MSLSDALPVLLGCWVALPVAHPEAPHVVPHVALLLVAPLAFPAFWFRVGRRGYSFILWIGGLSAVKGVDTGAAGAGVGGWREEGT